MAAVGEQQGQAADVQGGLEPTGGGLHCSDRRGRETGRVHPDLALDQRPDRCAEIQRDQDEGPAVDRPGGAPEPRARREAVPEVVGQKEGA